MKNLKMIVIASALALATGAASASTYKFTNTGSNTNWVPADELTDIERVDLSAPVAPAFGSPVYATAFEVKGYEVDASGDATGNPLESFIAWCMDISTSFFDAGAIRTKTSDFSKVSTGSTIAPDAEQNMQRLFDTWYGTALDSELSSAAFQVALWEILYDGDLDLSTGDFTASNATGFGDVVGAAQTLLDNLGSGPRQYTLTFYTSESNQDVVTATPIPLPATGLLLLGAFAGVGAMARRKARAKV